MTEGTKMKIFYVDFENVKDPGLNGIGKLNKGDVVRIYYSEDAQKMTFGLHRRIEESPATFEYKRISKDLKGVKNALDVLLMQDMSQRIIEEKSGEFFIVSNDGDYDHYISEKKKNGISINKISEVCKHADTANPKPKQTESKKQPADTAKQQELKKKEQAFRSHFGKYLKDDYDDIKEDILKAYMSAETRQELNNNLQQFCYNDAVKDILARLKDLIKNMPGNK